MSYQIQYGKTGMQIDLKKDSGRNKLSVPWKTIALIVAILCIYALNTKMVKDFFVPGDKEITRSAFQELDRSLREGQPFVEAFSDFCREIVQKEDIV